MPRFRQIAAGLSARRQAFGPTSVHVRFVVYKVTLGHISVTVIQFCPVSVIPPPHIQFHLHVARKPLNTKRRLPYLKTQFVPRSKHFYSLL